MRRLHTRGAMSAPGRLLLAPVAAVAAIAGVALMAVVAVIMLAVMLLPGARRRVKVFRFGGPGGFGPLDGAVPGPERAADAPPGAGSAGTEAPGEEKKPRSYAEIVEMWPLVLAASLLLPAVGHAKLLVPMDDSQANHQKAYGLTYWVLQRGEKCEWLLNYHEKQTNPPQKDNGKGCARLNHENGRGNTECC